MRAKSGLVSVELEAIETDDDLMLESSFNARGDLDNQVLSEAMIMACSHRAARCVKSLLRLDHRLARSSWGGEAAIVVAASACGRKGKVSIIDALLNAGASVDDSSSDGRTALMSVSADCNMLLAKKLLERQADVNALTQIGESALSFAIAGNCPKVVTVLIQHGARLDQTEGMGAYPVHFAVEEGHVAVLKNLLLQGADIFQKNSAGLTPLELARILGQRSCVKILENQLRTP